MKHFVIGQYHPPVMIGDVVRLLLAGRRWDLTVGKAEAIAVSAVQHGLVTVSSADRRALLGKSSRPRREGPRRVKRPQEGPPACALVAMDPPSQAVITAPPLRVTRDDDVHFDVLDCTLGGGNISAALLEAGAPFVRVAALDCDTAVGKTVGESLRHDFGGRSFRFFCRRMGEALRMFGERSFDAIVIDPGPCWAQVQDPARGFQVVSSDPTSLDLRYGHRIGQTSALQFLNRSDESELCDALTQYDPTTFAGLLRAKVVRAILKRRPFADSHDVATMLTRSSGGLEVPGDLWNSVTPPSKSHYAAKIIYALAAAVNDDARELRTAVTNSLPMLQPEGRLCAVTRHPYEAAIVEEVAAAHPFALLVSKVVIEPDEAEATMQPLSTTVWILQRTQRAASATKNALGGGLALTPDEAVAARMQQLTGLDARPHPKQYPAGITGFGEYRFRGVEEREEEAMAARAHSAPLLVPRSGGNDRGGRLRL